MRHQIAGEQTPEARNGDREHRAARNTKPSAASERLTERLVDVMRRTTGLGRTGAANAGGQKEFAFFAATDVFAALRTELASSGIMFRPCMDEIRDMSVGTRKFVTVLASYEFIDCETGESIKVRGAGRGNAAKHDGLAAARTGALKHALVRNFLLADVEDTDTPEGACRIGGTPASAAESGDRPRRKRGRKKATSLNGKLLEAIRAIGEVPRTGCADVDGYSFVRLNDLVAVLRPELVRRGVHLSTSVEGVEDLIEGERVLTRVRTAHVFRDAETGQTLEIHSAGDACAGGPGQDDPDEKLLYWALASAFKYALLEFLLVANSAPARPRQAAVAAQRRRLGIAEEEVAAAEAADWGATVLPGEPEAGRRLSEASPAAMETHLASMEPGASFAPEDRKLACDLFVALAHFKA